MSVLNKMKNDQCLNSMPGNVKTYNYQDFESKIEELKRPLFSHSLFSKIDTPLKMNCFMEAHIFAVWDFMSLLKALQKKLTCTTSPWLPPKNRLASRLINEITLGEESDEISPGQYSSHFEMYIKAMNQSGASTEQIEQFISLIQDGETIDRALAESNVHKSIQNFVKTTLSFTNKKTHIIAAAFLYGREDVIPNIFVRIVNGCQSIRQNKYSELKYYLERHIELDGDSHGPMGKKLIASLCGNDDTKWSEAFQAAQVAISARIHLWDEIEKELAGKIHN